MQIEILEVAGLTPAMQALRLPYSREPRSKKGYIHAYPLDGKITELNNEYIRHVFYNEHISKDDIALAQKLIKAGDEHAKTMRGVIAYMRIKAPIYWWCEAETYIAGHQRLCSESTMHIDCRGLQGEELQSAKAAIPMGKELTKIDFFSYQCLRNVWKQRHNHRLNEWNTFIDAIKQLPFANELIFIK